MTCFSVSTPVHAGLTILTAVPFSIKAAVTLGAIAGATVAVVQNREFLLEKLAEILEYGAKKCRKRLEEHNKIYACNYKDGEFAEYEYKSSTEASTPDTTDTEEIYGEKDDEYPLTIETDYDALLTDSDYDYTLESDIDAGHVILSEDDSEGEEEVRTLV